MAEWAQRGPGLGAPPGSRRSRRCECLFALGFAGVVLGTTLLLLVSVVVPLVQPRYQNWLNVVLGFLGVVALASGLYVLQIGWGALRWTQRYRREKDTDWYEKWKHASDASAPGTVKEWSQVQHFVIVTNYAETVEMLRLLAYTLMSQRVRHFCRRQITLVLAMEEREGPAAKQKAQTLQDELGPYFRDVLATFHPPDLPGEIKGKASNYKWAVGEVEAYVRDATGPAADICAEDCIIHVADADSLYDPNYFPNVTYLFCIRGDRHDLVWQPCMIPTCNLWQVAPPCRQVNIMIAAQEMMSAYDPQEFQVPFSTYGVSLVALQHIGGSGNARDAQDGDVIAEDHHLFIKGFIATRGQMRVQPVFLPCLNFSVGGQQTSLYKNVCDRYIQAKRHMFGISELFYLASHLSRSCRCCRRRPSSCRERWRTFALCAKLLKIHCIPYSGPWVLLGLVLVSLLKLQKSYCGNPESEPSQAVCSHMLGDVTESHGAVIFTVATSLTFVGGVFVVGSFAWMLYVAHHTLMNIGDPNGDFMSSVLWDTTPPAKSPRGGRHLLRRPVVVGDSYPWCGTVIQLVIEFLSLSLMTSMVFGSVPAVLGLVRFIVHGHTMEYITAPKGPPAPGVDLLAPDTLEVSLLSDLPARSCAGSPAALAVDLEVPTATRGHVPQQSRVGPA